MDVSKEHDVRKLTLLSGVAVAGLAGGAAAGQGEPGDVQPVKTGADLVGVPKVLELKVVRPGAVPLDDVIADESNPSDDTPKATGWFDGRCNVSVAKLASMAKLDDEGVDYLANGYYDSAGWDEWPLLTPDEQAAYHEAGLSPDKLYYPPKDPTPVNPHP